MLFLQVDIYMSLLKCLETIQRFRRFVERVVWKVAFTLGAQLTVQTCSCELAEETKNSSKLWEFEIADSKGVKGKSKGSGCEFEITKFEITEFELAESNCRGPELAN